MELASRVYLWFVGLVIHCLWFIETWWGQRKRDKEKRVMNKLARLWDKFLTWPWWPAIKEAIEDKKNKKG